MQKMFEILHEDASLLVIAKPAGLVCHPTKGDEYSSLISRVRLHLHAGLENAQSADSGAKASCPAPGTDQAGPASPDVPSGGPIDLPKDLAQGPINFSRPPPCAQARPQLVNRLDRETSGVVLVAKDDRTARELRRLVEGRLVRKEYLAIVHGHLRENHGRVEAPLGRDLASAVKIKDCVRIDGSASRTDFQVREEFTRPEGNFTLLGVSPHTGRKHQIRIHLAHIGHPIVGDKLYGGDEDLYLALVQNRLTQEQRRRLILPHHALHAQAVSFDWNGRPWTFRAKAEPWFTEFCSGGAAR